MINKLKMSRFNAKSVAGFYAEHKDKPFFPALKEFMTSDVTIGMELVAQDAVAKWRQLIGPTDTNVAKQ